MLAYPMFWLSMTQGVSFALPNKSSGAGGTGSCHTAGRVWGGTRTLSLLAMAVRGNGCIEPLAKSDSSVLLVLDVGAILFVGEQPCLLYMSRRLRPTHLAPKWMTVRRWATCARWAPFAWSASA